MTLYQFNTLDEMEQAEVLWDKGVYIADRQDAVHRYILYQVGSFYVEVWYHIEYNTIRRFRTFSSVHQLDPYISNIKLPEGIASAEISPLQKQEHQQSFGDLLLQQYR